jgi:RNA polymerase sigma-70 factor (ECF subfamily)
VIEQNEFAQLLEALRRGNNEAATAIFAQYEAHVRRVIRFRLRDPQLRRHLDSIDISQSVFGDFFTRFALGEYNLDSPAQLLSLLAVIARNKTSHVVEHHHAARRDVRKAVELDTHAIPRDQSTPSDRVARQELISRFRDHMTPEERYIADQRANGASWGQLAAELKTDADALRIRFSRAIDRVARELGL